MGRSGCCNFRGLNQLPLLFDGIALTLVHAAVSVCSIEFEFPALVKTENCFIQLGIVKCQVRKGTRSKETTLERADFTLHLLMFVNAEKEGRIFIIIYLLSFVSAVVPAISS